MLADASVVILALPAIYREYHAEVADVAWVVTSFNLAIALTAVPAARLATRLPAGRVCAGGLVLFAASSAACALAPTLGFLIGARALQGMGGAAAVCAALELLPELAGGEKRAVRVWASAGIAGAALGPAIGGLLTQLISWQSIFVVQVPLALIPVLVVAGRGAPNAGARAGWPHIAANVALGLLSAGLAAVLFLLVLLLVEGWRMPPIAAALVVTVMPVAAVCAGPFERRVADTRVRAAAGTLLGAAVWPRSDCCRARAGSGRCCRSCSSASASRCPWAHSPRRRWRGGRPRRSTAASRSHHGTRASCSVCSC